MTDDLVKRLRYQADEARKNYPEVFRVSEEIAYEAADHIEQLEIEKNRSYRNLTHAMKHIEKLEAALRHIELEAPRGSFFNDIARKALEEKDD